MEELRLGQLNTVLENPSAIAFCIGGWMVLNGLLHDIFVLRSEHGKKYDRELLRLLMDGHVLITFGAIQMLVYRGLQVQSQWACLIAGIACISLLVYCAMIFPFLKSLVTMALNTLPLILLIAQYRFVK